MSGFGIGMGSGLAGGTDTSPPPVAAPPSGNSPDFSLDWMKWVYQGAQAAQPWLGKGGILDDFIFTDQEKAVVDKGGVYAPPGAVPGVPGQPAGGSPTTPLVGVNVDINWWVVAAVGGGVGLVVWLAARKG